MSALHRVGPIFAYLYNANPVLPRSHATNFPHYLVYVPLC